MANIDFGRRLGVGRKGVSVGVGLRLALALAAGVLITTGCRPDARSPSRPVVVLIGDSTTRGYGGPSGFVFEDSSPLATLTALLPETSRWHNAEIVNLGVGTTTTLEWAVATKPCPVAPVLPPDVPLWARLVARACVTGAPLVQHVPELVGRPIELALVVLGTNDPYREPAATPEQALVNLQRISAALAPAEVLIASPFWTPDPARHAFVESLATLLVNRGLLTGPDFARMRLPVDASNVHLTYGGFVAAAALWLDALPAAR